MPGVSVAGREGDPTVYGFDSYVAIGDSFTEGLNDPCRTATSAAGPTAWPELLAAQQPGLRYANLAIRGKLLAQILAEQLPIAPELAPDMVCLRRRQRHPAPGGRPGRPRRGLRKGRRRAPRRRHRRRDLQRLRPASTPLMRRSGAPASPPTTGTCGPSPSGTAATWSTCGPWTPCTIPGRGATTGCTLTGGAQPDRLAGGGGAGGAGRGRMAGALAVGRPSCWLDGRRADLRWTREHFLPWIRRQFGVGRWATVCLRSGRSWRRCCRWRCSRCRTAPSRGSRPAEEFFSSRAARVRR